MRIGIVSSYFYPWYGGITEHVYYQYKELRRRGFDVKLITPFDGCGVLEHKEDLIQIGKPVSLLLNGSVVKVPLLYHGEKRVNQIIQDYNFDILHLHQPIFCVLGLTFLRCIRKSRAMGKRVPKIVGTFHACGGGTERFLIKRLGFYFKRYAPEFDFRIAVSLASKNFIEPILPGNYEIIPNGVEIERFSHDREKISRFDDGVFNILFVGRLEPRKGLTNLLQSIPYIKCYSDKPFRLIIVGNGFLTGYYKSRVPREVNDKVTFIGEVSFRDLPKFYNTAHVFCSPATYGESFGIVLIEAMAAGLPIIAGNNEGYRKVIHNGVNGILVNPENPREIASNIASILESSKKRQYLSENARDEAKKYSWKSIVDRIQDVYHQFSLYPVEL